MVSQGFITIEPTGTTIAREDLVREIDSRTNRQVRDLDIACIGSRLRVTGRSGSYYVKQLVTQAVLTAAPSLSLDNAIEVCRN